MDSYKVDDELSAIWPPAGAELNETQHRVVMKADSAEARALAEHDAGLVLMSEGFLEVLRGNGGGL